MDIFLEGSVDHIIYKDYIVNRSSFIYSSLVTEHGLITFLAEQWSSGGASDRTAAHFRLSEEVKRTKKLEQEQRR